MKSIKKEGQKIARENAAGKRASMSTPTARKIRKEDKDIEEREIEQDDETARKGDKADNTMGRYRSMRK